MTKSRFGARAVAKGRLTPCHRRFVEEYLVDLNAMQAASRAGYAGKGGGMLLRRPAIAAAIEQAFSAREEKARITSDRVLQEYGRMAFANMRDFADWGPSGVTLRPKSDLSEADAAAVAEIVPSGSNGKGGRIKLYDKKAALDALARHLGLFDPKARLGNQDRSAAGDEARRVLRERILKLMKRSG